MGRLRPKVMDRVEKSGTGQVSTVQLNGPAGSLPVVCGVSVHLTGQRQRPPSPLPLDHLALPTTPAAEAPRPREPLHPNTSWRSHTGPYVWYLSARR